MKNNMSIFLILISSFLCSIKSQDSIPAIYTKGGGFTPDTIIKYKETKELEHNLYFFYPESFKQGESRPTIVFFFGGGWKGGHVNQFYPQSEYLASRGMIAICADYRTEKDGVEPWQCVEDSKSAIRFVRKNAEILGVDPDKLAAGGGSAGGHLAAATASIKEYNCPDDDLSVSSIPNALVLFNPVYDNGPNGYGYERVKDYYKSISPIDNLDGIQPPTIVFMGDLDKHTPVETTKLFDNKMEANGNRCETYIYEGQKHGFFNLHKSLEKKYFIETAKEMDRFLSSLGFLHSEPTIVEWFDGQEKSIYDMQNKWDSIVRLNNFNPEGAFQFVEANPELPDVLLIGTSISIGYTSKVRKILVGKANVYRIPQNGGHTRTMLDNQEIWLPGKKWDVIHFNFGLHDLKYVIDGKLDQNGEQVVPIEEYQLNMDTIVSILKNSLTEQGKIIFATTSVIPEQAKGRVKGDEVKYNTAALQVMSKYPEIRIDDQYSLTLRHPEEQREQNVHFHPKGKERQGKQAAEIIQDIMEQ
jgi:acetyl esterase